MKYALLVSFFFISLSSFGQLKGTWQGLLIKKGESYDKASIIYFEFAENGKVKGRTREEVPGKEGYAIRKLEGEISGAKAQLKQTQIESRKDISGVRWCALEFTVEYIDSTGYLTGTFMSNECRGNMGKIICYRRSEGLPKDATSKELQSWRPILAEDLKHNRKAPEVRELERKNFVFKPIYFDFDKTEIKPEYVPFLNNLVRVVNGHSDLRIKVTGYTDSRGSDIYNVDLSERRAKAIIDFFVNAGVARDRIQIDFKGETSPIGDNTTDEGRQLNRRVDFAFI